MAITRAQIPEQIDIFNEGGAAETDSYTTLYNDIVSQYQPDYDASYDKYVQRLSQYAPEKPKMSIFEVASEIGRGLLSTPNTGVGSTYKGLGAGFDNVSRKIQADKKMYEDQRREIQMMATQLAMQDEQKAQEFLNQIAIKKIEAANKEVDYITLEYDEVIDGETITQRRRIPDTTANATVINELYENNNAREIKPVTAQTNINMPGGSTKADEKALDQMFKDQEIFGEKAEASNATLDQVSQARVLAEEIGEEDFGPFSRSTLYLREFVDGIGFGDLLEDPSKIAPQKALNQLSMGFTMGIVSQTKGAISDREMKLFIQASPTLGSTYQGYMKQLELLERLAARDSQFYQEYINKSMELDESGLSLRKQQLELEKFASSWKKDNPLFTKEETKELEDIVQSGQGLSEDFNRNEFEQSINSRKKQQAQKRVSGVVGVPDGSTEIGEVNGAKFYLKPGGDVNNPDDIIKVE